MENNTNSVYSPFGSLTCTTCDGLGTVCGRCDEPTHTCVCEGIQCDECHICEGSGKILDADATCENCGESEMEDYTLEDSAIGFDKVIICTDCLSPWIALVNDSFEVMPVESPGYYFDEDGAHQY